MKEAIAFRLCLLIVGVGCLLLFGTLTRGHEWGDDFASYIMQARSLTEGTPRSFIEANRFTIQQSSNGMGPVAYPWGFAVLLAPAYAVSGLNMIALKSVCGLFYLFFLISLWFVFRRSHSPSILLCLVCLFALNPTLLAFSNHIMSDLPFLFFSMLSLGLIGAFITHKSVTGSRLADATVLGLVIAAAFFIRTNGVLLLITLGLSQVVMYAVVQAPIWRRIWNESQKIPLKKIRVPGEVSLASLLIHATTYLSFFCAVTLWESALPDGGSYQSFLKGISAGTIKANALHYLLQPAEFYSGIPYHRYLYVLSLPFALLGAMKRLRSDYPAIIYGALTICLLVAWPFTQGLRFLFPLLPFYISFVLSGLEVFQGGTTPRGRALRKLAFVFPIVLVIASLAWLSARGVYENMSRDRETSFGPFTETSMSFFSFITEQTKPESTVVFFKPRLMRMMTDRKSLRITAVEKLPGADYLCIYLIADAADVYSNQITGLEVRELVERGIADLVYSNDDFTVYRLSRRPKESHEHGPGPAEP